VIKLYGPSHEDCSLVYFPFVLVGLDRVALCRPGGNLRSYSYLVYRTELSSDHWPHSIVGGYNFGCYVDGPLSLPHDQLLVLPCLEILKCSRSQGILELSPKHWTSWCREWMPCKLGDRGAISRPSPSGGMRRFLSERFGVALHHAVRLQAQERGARLTHSKALQNVLWHTRHEFTALVSMYLPRYAEAA
jgi:hypothetical protein